MSGYDRILASTALALILAAPIGAALAQDKPAVTAAAPTAAISETATATTTGAIPAAAPAAPEQQPAAAAPAVAPEQPAVAATPAADPLAALDPADRVIAERLRDLLAKSDKLFANKKERAAVEAFYQNRNLAPLWFDKGVESARAKAAAARLKAADADGLDAADYKLPTLPPLGADAQAEAELKFTQVVLTYARHLQAGRFPYTRISNNIELPQAPPDVGAVLTQIADAKDVAKALDAFSPPQPQYQKLKAALAEFRNKSGGGHKEIADGPVLKLVAKTPMEDPRVPALRERLNVGGDASDTKYDAKVAEAVKKFQKANDIPVTGNLDAKTVKELNGPPKGHQIDVIIANMERWRWYPRDLGKAYSMVNQPDFTLRVMEGDKLLWTTRVVIGKPGQMATPLLTETMKYITVNPTWNVPPSIVHNEYLPALKQDPTVLSRMGLKVVNNRDGSVQIYQPPGEANALGRIRFNFPNRFLVYQHDTPDKHLFAHESRAYSHGCMRVQDPAKYAEVMLGLGRPQDGYTAERIKKMYGTSETDLHFTSPVPVHLTYQSAFVDDDGKLQFRKDVYGLDARMIGAIKTERAVVEPQAERPKEVASGNGSNRKPQQPATRQMSFIEQLFGVGSTQGAPPRSVPNQRRVSR
jgi:murein L,D-transpeptidase YcbB/YkuD